MRICLIAEGCYPYVAGGVSSWVQMLMKGMPEHTFVIYTIGANESQRGQYKYELPPNVEAVEENFLDQYMDVRVKKAILYIRDHMSESINIEDIAEMLYVSKNYFIRIFKKETGTTPVNFIIQRKIERAQLLLITESQPIKEIALSVGFEDFSYFNRVFKKVTGITPNEYRKEARHSQTVEGDSIKGIG